MCFCSGCSLYTAGKCDDNGDIVIFASLFPESIESFFELSLIRCLLSF